MIINISQTKSFRIFIYFFVGIFISTNAYAFSRVSPLGSVTDDDKPSGMNIEDFLDSTTRKTNSILDKNDYMLKSLNREIDYGSQATINERVSNERFIQQQVEETRQRYNEAFAVHISEGQNDDTTQWTNYSGKSIKQIKSVLDMAGFSNLYSEVSNLLPEGDHAHSWSLILNYQQDDSSKVKFRLTLNDKNGLSESTFSLVKEKIFSEEDEEEVNEDDSSNDAQAASDNNSDEDENKNSNKDSELQGEFHWVEKKIVQTDIKHQTGSKTYANNETIAYDFVTNFHETIYYLNSNKVLERDVESEYDIDKKVATKEHSINYEYNSITGSKNRAHVYETTREMSPDDYIESSEEEKGWLLGKYKETIIDNRGENKITTKFVELSYDEEDKVKEQISVVHEESNSGLDNWYVTVENNYSYISVDDLDLNQIRSYNSFQLDGNFNSEEEAFGFAKDIIKLNPDEIDIEDIPEGIKLQMQEIKNIKYNEEGRQKEISGTAKVLGKDENDGLSYQYDFLRDNFEYDDMDRVAGHREKVFNSTVNPDKTVITNISDIEYDYKGLEISRYEEIHEQGPGLDRTITNEITDRVYNDLGQVVSYTQITNDSASPDNRCIRT